MKNQSKKKEEMVEKTLTALEQLRAFLASEALQDRDVRRTVFSYLAKSITQTCLRDTTLEDMHAGTYVEIPDEVSRISNEEMKLLMREFVTNVGFYLEVLATKPALFDRVIAIGVPTRWNNPDWELVDQEIKELEDILAGKVKR